jgi:hypothetical protein
MTQELIDSIKDRFLVFEDIGLEVLCEYIFTDNMKLVGTIYEFEKVGIAILVKVPKDELFNTPEWESINYTEKWLNSIGYKFRRKYVKILDNDILNPTYFIYEDKYDEFIKTNYPDMEYNVMNLNLTI